MLSSKTDLGEIFARLRELEGAPAFPERTCPMSSVWIYQDPKQVNKVGEENASRGSGGKTARPGRSQDQEGVKGPPGGSETPLGGILEGQAFSRCLKPDCQFVVSPCPVRNAEGGT